MMIVRLLMLCMMTISAFGATELQCFEENVRVLPSVALPSGGVLVAERLNYADEIHYAAAQLLDPQSLTDTSSASSLLPLFPQWHEAMASADGTRIKEISDMVRREPSLPFFQYIVFLENAAEKNPVGTFALSIPDVDEDESLGFRTEFTVFILKDFRGEYKGSRLARLMNDMMGALVGRMLSKSCHAMGDEGDIAWSSQGLDGWFSIVGSSNVSSLALDLSTPHVGVVDSKAGSIKFLWPANDAQIAEAEELRNVVEAKKAAFKASQAFVARAHSSGGASSS